MADWSLAIDFGTTFTVGAMVDDGRVTLVDVEGNGTSRIPSAVWLDDEGGLAVGSAALHQAVFAPDRFEPTPKRAMGEGEILLGDRLVPITDVVAAIIGRVAGEARRIHGDTPPRKVCLTHPAVWADVRIGVLASAAEQAGLPEPQLMPEPVAAALRIGARRIEVGQQVAVYDFGGGTFDAAIVRRTPDGFEVTGRPGGRDPLGGEDIDQRILGYLGRCPIGDEPDWSSLLHPPDARWRRAAADLRLEIRKAKEELSRTTTWQLWVPGMDRELQLTRRELEDLIVDDVDATLDVLDETIAAAGCSSDELAGIFLVGGSSRIPLVADAIWRRFQRRPDVQDDPKAVVAVGAAGWALAQRAPPQGSRAGTQPPAGPAAGRIPTREFRSRLAMLTVTPLWLQSGQGYASLTLSGKGLIVRVDDAPAGDADSSALARAAAERWAQTPGYAELSLDRAQVLGNPGGLERRLIADHPGTGVGWFERYLASDGRALVVTAQEEGRHVADAVRLARPGLDPRKHYEPCFLAELPEGWDALERVEFVRAGRGHRIVSESLPVPPGSSTPAWAKQQADALAESVGRVVDGPSRTKVLGRGEGVAYTFSNGDGELTRLWMLVGEGRGYRVRVSLPERERLSFRLLVAHAVLARPLAVDGAENPGGRLGRQT